jgi:N-hydroxyarylamine O-acetyltransferase
VDPTRAAQGIDVPGYLRRLGLADPGAPSLDALRRLHGAHVERVPYETVWIALRRARSVDPVESCERIVAGYGGYCFQLNGAFAALLTALGYRVTLHLGAVLMRADTPLDAELGNHLAVTVRLDGQDWMVDVGLGNALHEPLPLRPGAHRQGPFTFTLHPSPLIPGGWRFGQDPQLTSFSHLDFQPGPALPEDFADKHAELSSDPQSPFVRVITLARRDRDGVDQLRGTVLTRFDADGRHDRELRAAAEWFTVVDRRFGLRPDDLDEAARAALWRRVLDTPPPRPR